MSLNRYHKSDALIRANKSNMLLRAKSDDFVITRKKLHKGRMAPNGYLFLHVTYKCKIRGMKYSVTKFIAGNQGEQAEAEICIQLINHLCDSNNLKLKYE